MGKQILSSSRNLPDEITEKTVPSNAIFSCGNCCLMILTVIVAILVTAVLVKATELQTLNEEKDATIDSLAGEAEELKQKLYKAISEGNQQMKLKETLIGDLKSKIKVLKTDSDDLNKQLGKTELEISALTTETKKSSKTIKDQNREIETLKDELSKNKGINLENTKKIQSKSSVIKDLTKEVSELKQNFEELNDDLIEEESKSSLLMEENSAINTKIGQHIEEIKELNKNEKGNMALLAEKEASLAKSTENLEKSTEEFKETKNILERLSTMKDNEIGLLKKEMKERVSIFDEEKNQLEITNSDNKDAFKQETLVLEKQFQNEISRIKSDDEKDIQQLKGVLAAKEQEMVEKVSLINSLKEQNLQVSDELTKYSEEIKIQIRTLQNQRERCEVEAKESLQSLMSELEKEQDDLKSVSKEKLNMENLLENKYKVLEKELKILETQRSHLQTRLEKANIELSSFGDEKIKLEITLEEKELEISQLEDTNKSVQVDIGNCIVEKREETGKVDILEKSLNNLKKDKVIKESHFVELKREIKELKSKSETNIIGEENTVAENEEEEYEKEEEYENEDEDEEEEENDQN